MTWNEQVRGLKRHLSRKVKNPAALARKRKQQQLAKEPRPQTIVISGTVSQTFLDRMRAKRITVVVKQ